MNRLDRSLDEERPIDGSRETQTNQFGDNDSGIKTGFPVSKPILSSDKTSGPIFTQSNTNIQTFGSLADLTAHHLKKSSSSGGISSPVIGSPNAAFVIPKLWTRSDSAASSPKNQFSEASSSLNSDAYDTQILSQTKVKKIQKRDDKIDDKIPVANFLNTRTPSPEDWVIDLSAALSETFSKVSTPNEKLNSKLSDDLCQDISRLDIYLNTKTPEIIGANSSNVFFDCNLNSSSMQHIKLGYSKEVVSSFGKILCRRWKTRKPYIRSEPHVDVIMPFDFSIPSPDDRILVHLRKRL